MRLPLWRFHQTTRRILLKLLLRFPQSWYSHGISSCKVSHMIRFLLRHTGHTFRFFRKRKPEQGFTVNVIALTLPTTIRCTTKAIVVSYKLRMTIQLCGLRTTNMLRPSLDVAHCHCILAILRRVEAPTVSSVLYAQETSKRSSWRLDCGHRNDKENSKCTTQPNNGYLRRISHSFTCRYRFIHFRTFVGSL